MDYLQRPSYHYKPRKGWINDPNGLVYFKGYYHVFYQHAPDREVPEQPIHWGHARTKNFVDWEELPVALYPDKEYDSIGCWSGTAIVKEDTLYLFYASVKGQEWEQTVSVAYSTDGIRFEKYKNNPVIDHYPADGGRDFRDPAVCCIDGQYYCVMASGNPETKTARLLLYKSENLFDWDYVGIMCEWGNGKFAECPSFVMTEDHRYLLTASVCPIDKDHYFSVMYGSFSEGKFTVEYAAEVDKGPDQYAGQVFHDPRGRDILISWIPGWPYRGYVEKDVGCMSVPRELKLVNGKITGYPVEEVQHLLKDTDPAVIHTETGFVINRTGRDPVVYEGEIADLKILRDGYVLEVFINGGEEVYAALL